MSLTLSFYFWFSFYNSTSEFFTRLQLHRETKVRQFNVSLIVQQDVFRFKVTVDNVEGVEVLHSLQQSSHDTPVKKEILR